MTPSERKVLHAVGKASLATKLPIFTHTANGEEAMTQVDILESLGVPLDRVAIGHLGSRDDPVGLEFVIRPPLEAGPCPGSGRSNAHG